MGSRNRLFGVTVEAADGKAPAVLFSKPMRQGYSKLVGQGLVTRAVFYAACVLEQLGCRARIVEAAGERLKQPADGRSKCC